MKAFENKLHVLMISAQYMPEVFGGAEQQCQKLSKKLVENGINVTVLTSRKNKNIPAQEIIDGVHIIRLHSFGPPQLMNVKYMHSTFIWMMKAFKWAKNNKNDFDIVHVHQAKLQAYIGLRIAKKYNKRSLIKVGNSGNGFDLLTLKRKPFFGKKMYEYVIKNIDLIIAISTHIQKEIEDTGIDKSKIIFLPNGVELVHENFIEDKKLIREKLHVNQSKKVFLFVGRIEKQKDVLLLAESFAATNPEKNNWLLIFVGSGDLQNNLQAFINNNHLQENIMLAGYQKNVTPYLLAADYFILSTRTEGLSNALLEAMSVGLIPISSKVSGSVDVITPGEIGFLTEPSSMASLISAIKAAGNLSAPEQAAYSKSAKEVINKKYEMNFITQQYIQLYQKLLQQNN